MIRISAESDRSGLIALWQEAFGDSEKAIEFFLDNRYVAEKTVVSEDNGKTWTDWERDKKFGGRMSNGTDEYEYFYDGHDIKFIAVK